jgi:hypothetical protein
VRASSRWLAIAVLVILAAAPRASRATEPGKSAEACIAEHEGALRDRKGGAWQRARAGFRSCSDAGCPALVREACERLAVDLEDKIPRLVVRAIDHRGRDVEAATLRVDGERVVDKLDGRAIELDPGRHVVRIDRGAKHATTTLVMREGDHPRTVTLRLPGPPAKRKPPADTGYEVPTASWVLGGFGVAGLAAFAVAAALGKAEQDELESTCAPSCSPEAIDAMRSRYLAADISLILGASALVAGGVVAIAAALDDGDVGVSLGPAGAAFRAAF